MQKFYIAQGYERLYSGQIKGVGFISKENFDKWLLQRGAVIIGQTRLKEARPEASVGLSCTDKEGKKRIFLVSEYKGGRAAGYIPVGKREFVALVKAPNKTLKIAAACAFIIVTALAVMTLTKEKNIDSGTGVGYEPSAQVIKVSSDKDMETKKTTAVLPSVMMPGWDSITIPADETEIEEGINLFNPSQNEGYYDLVFEIRADVDGDGIKETLCRTGKVAPGFAVTKLTLSEPVPEGEYDVDIFIQPYLKGAEESGLNNGIAAIRLYSVGKEG